MQLSRVSWTELIQSSIGFQEKKRFKNRRTTLSRAPAQTEAAYRSRLPTRWAIFPERAYQLGLLHATLMAPYFRAGAWMVFLLYVMALLVGITRVYVAAHYPRDVLAGDILGSVWGLLVQSSIEEVSYE